MVNLKIERIKKKMTQKELADVLGVTARHISRYENGESYPTVEKLIRLSAYFNVSLDYLVKGEKTVSDSYFTREETLFIRNSIFTYKTLYPIEENFKNYFRTISKLEKR